MGLYLAPLINFYRIYSGSNVLYADSHDALTGTVDSTVWNVFNVYYTSTHTYQISRACLPFDFSSVPDIVSARLCFWPQYCLQKNAGQADLNLIRPDFATPPVGTNYHDLLDEVVSGGQLLFANLPASGWAFVPLNATGLSWLPNLAWRISGDINNTTPTGSNVMGAANGVGIIVAAIYTNLATLVTGHTARLNGIYNGKSDPWGFIYEWVLIEVTSLAPSPAYPRVYFRWGPTVALEYTTPYQTGMPLGNYSADLVGLNANTTYYFQAVLESSPGVINYGFNILNFTTPIASPTVTTLPATGVT
jgi:hypothetical protein